MKDHKIFLKKTDTYIRMFIVNIKIIKKGNCTYSKVFFFAYSSLKGFASSQTGVLQYAYKVAYRRKKCDLIKNDVKPVTYIRYRSLVKLLLDILFQSSNIIQSDIVLHKELSCIIITNVFVCFLSEGHIYIICLYYMILPRLKPLN